MYFLGLSNNIIFANKKQQLLTSQDQYLLQCAGLTYCLLTLNTDLAIPVAGSEVAEFTVGCGCVSFYRLEHYVIGSIFIWREVQILHYCMILAYLKDEKIRAIGKLGGNGLMS